MPEPLAAPPATDDTAADPNATNAYETAAKPTAAPTAMDAGRYRLGAELARGGMGIVYRAEDLALHREVAVKVLSPELVGTDAARRFTVEAEVTAGLQHPSIPPVHDLGTLSDGRPYLAMKLIRGETLAKKLAARTNIAADRDDLLAAFEQICTAVAFAHSRRVIHRDLKPANVMVGAFSEVQVMDWGLAKRLGQPDELGDGVPAPDGAAEEWGSADDRTRAGAVMGTPSYMPPEQARGETAWVDERADVFALGGILCAILTGQPPYSGRDSKAVRRKATAADLTDALAALDAVDGAGKYPKVAKRCLEPDAAKRYAHAGEVAAAAHDARTRVETARRQEELHEAVDESDRAGRRERWSRRWWQIVGASGLAFGAFAFFFGGCIRDFQERSSGAPRETSDLRLFVPLFIEHAATEADAKTFQRGWNGTRRDEVLGRIQRAIGQRNGRSEAVLCVLLAAIADVSKDRDEVERWWADAVKRMPVSPAGSPEAALCLEVVRDFSARPVPTAIDRAALKRAAARLSQFGPAEIPEERQKEAEDARAKLKNLIGEK